MNHYDLSDNELESRFEQNSLSPELFNHEAHLRLAWIHIKRYGVEEAIGNLSMQIRRFAQSHGDADKFHVTVTVAAVRAVDHFFQKSGTATFPEFISENPRLKSEFRELIESHYTGNIFQSEAARKSYIRPDKQPFD